MKKVRLITSPRPKPSPRRISNAVTIRLVSAIQIFTSRQKIDKITIVMFYISQHPDTDVSGVLIGRSYVPIFED